MRAVAVPVVVALATLVACGAGTYGRPDAYLTAGSTEVEADRGTSCWSLAPGRSECLDAAGPRGGPGGTTLRVRRGAVVGLRFDRDDAPETLGAALDPAPVGGDDAIGVAVEPSNPTSFVVDVPPGTYDLGMGTAWPQGDMEFSLRIVVR